MKITTWPDEFVSGAKRANVRQCLNGDWFVGEGKCEGNDFEGTWWDLICFARNVLASENTKIAAPKFHRPDWAIKHYTGGEPYTFEQEVQS